jgi:hypothetical protein
MCSNVERLVYDFLMAVVMCLAAALEGFIPSVPIIISSSFKFHIRAAMVKDRMANLPNPTHNSSNQGRLTHYRTKTGAVDGRPSTIPTS